MIEHWPSVLADVDGASLNVVRGGSGPRNVVLLHGLTDDGRCWDRVAEALVDDFDLVVPDARGHGRSSAIGPDGFSVPRLAADVAGLLDRLGLRDALVFGHSMGAITAAALAAERPDLVRAVVLEDPPLDVPHVSASARREETRADLASWRALAPGERHVRAAVAHPEWARIETDPWADSKADVDPMIVDHLDLFDGYDWRGVFDRLTVPGLLVTGDPAIGAIATPATAHEAIGRWSTGRILHVAGAGHSIHRDAWDAAMDPVRAELRARA